MGEVNVFSLSYLPTFLLSNPVIIVVTYQMGYDKLFPSQSNSVVGGML